MVSENNITASHGLTGVAIIFNTIRFQGHFALFEYHITGSNEYACFLISFQFIGSKIQWLGQWLGQWL